MLTGKNRPFAVVTILAVVAMFIGPWLLRWEIPQLAWLFVGMGFGATLAATPLGFAGNWRRAVVDRDGSGVAAHLLLLAVVGAVTMPLLAREGYFAFDRPIGVPLLFGSFIFGVGMQLGGSCTSGSLQRAGGGSVHGMLLILGFVIGGFAATGHYEWWSLQPNWLPYSVAKEWGWPSAVGFNVLCAALLALLVAKVIGWRIAMRPAHWIGVALLVVFSGTAVWVLQHPWGIVTAFPLIAAKFNLWWNDESEVDFWVYWMQPEREQALIEPLWNDAITVMNAGLVFGAALWGLSRGGWRLEWQLPLRVWLLAPLAGIVMGYGALLSYGCNIGSLLGGVASGSVHGWLWLASAFAGSTLVCLITPRWAELMRSH